MFCAALVGLVLAALASLVTRPDLPISWFSQFETHTVGDDSLTLADSEQFPELTIKTHPGSHFLVVVSPKDPVNNPLTSEWLAEWLREHKMWFKNTFFEYGAVLFRGFTVTGPLGFEHMALAMTPDLATQYLGTSPRSSIENTTYVHTAADFNPHRTVPPHIEMSFRDEPPELQIFYAYKMDQLKGGETPLVDFSGVWNTLKQDEHFRAKVETSNLTYIRNMDDCARVNLIDPLVQKCWQQMFKTDNRTAVKDTCAEENFECSWNAEDRMRIANKQPFVRRHPHTGESVWFNHINVLHRNSMQLDYGRTATLWGGIEGLWPLCLGLYYQALYTILDAFWPEEELGSTILFENGSTFSREEVLAIKRAIWRNTVQEPYEVNDVVILDNLRVGHGREIYMGVKESRQVMTAWSDKYPAEWREEAAVETPSVPATTSM
mmetsp:Transcript_43735/g.115520  ORF Transcript_43735/g.115520 Transcript_43735/m.115520 type:complete len:435 (-) Transcript_43735:223-1527(-)|eukprot:CAMPEP_0194490644 /NCGR_PEP_ID=MMETSP0253-20130528/9795_1 /TAXON_ID=2966 /ORGANISM="Noctiluca scintillans" /LENGTH=434 /DNA_ID=CAMNT_0039331293 /DNA_START=37 /DNA_END=1341 /DNA_ORIENTATION=-